MRGLPHGTRLANEARTIAHAARSFGGVEMAYLNVRERRVETKIAYVGPGGAGKATNLEQVGLRATPRTTAAARVASDEIGEVLSLDWAAPPNVHFRDCSLSVRLMAQRGPASAERTRAMVRDADGVILVLDATPSAREENRAVAALVRDAIAASKRQNVPVVVQVNKTDLADALAPAVLLEDLGETWPHIGAAAARGEGVLETLERALSEILTSLREQEVDVDTARVPATTTPRAEGNPLLAALRQVLRDTVSEHVAELEARFAQKIDSALAKGSANVETESLRDLVRASTEETQRSIAELRAFIATGMQETTRALAAHATALAALQQRTNEGEAYETVGPELAKLTAETATRVHELQGLIERAKEETRSDLIRALDVRSRTDREHATSALTPIRKALDGLVAEAKQTDARGHFAQLGESIAAIRTQAESLPEVTTLVRGLEKGFQRDMRDHVGRRIGGIEELVRAAAAEAQQSSIGTDEKIGELVNRLNELGEELKKKEKKGWFA